MHASLKWFGDNFGAPFAMDHWAVKHFRFHAVHHTGKQAPELEPWEFINLALLMSKVQGSHKLLVAFVLMVATSCIRFEHVQRSKFLRSHSSWLEFHCSQGKSRKQGARPGYAWGVPQVTMNGHHVTKVLLEFFTHEFPEDQTFIMPALALSPEELWEITESTAFIANKPMSRARFLEVMRGALVQVGVDVPLAQSATYNKLRRFLPTMANIMELPDLDLQALGNWCDIPAGGGRDPAARKPRGSVPMGVHYAGSRVLRSLQVKQRCVDRIFGLYYKKRQELAMTEDGFLCRDAWLWAEVAALHQSLPEELTPLAQTASLGDIEVAAGALPAGETCGPPEGGDLPVSKPSSSSSAASSDSSSSASDESASGHDLCGVVADTSAPDELSWMKQGRKVHLVREEVDGRPVPWCRDFAYDQDPSERGHGFTVTSRDAFCQRCLGRVPRGLYLALAEHCQMSRIDVHQDDRGLSACLAGANIKEEWKTAYLRVHHVVTLDDFVYMVKATDWERSLGDLLAQVPEIKDSRIAEARFKSAFEAGQQALKHAAQSAPKSEDLDEALPDSTVQQSS
eukprot:s4807_g5.t1